MKKYSQGLIIETFINHMRLCPSEAYINNRNVHERCQAPKKEGECFGEKV